MLLCTSFPLSGVKSCRISYPTSTEYARLKEVIELAVYYLACLAPFATSHLASCSQSEQPAHSGQIQFKARVVLLLVQDKTACGYLSAYKRPHRGKRLFVFRTIYVGLGRVDEIYDGSFFLLFF